MKRSILYVEDNMINQQLAKMVITTDDLDLAGDGQQAVDMFKAKKYDLVLMDVNLPIKGGVEATREIREYEAANGLTKTPIVAVTADWDNSVQDMCFGAGMNSHLIKPFDAESYNNLVDNLEELTV